MTGDAFEVSTFRGSAAELHQRQPPDPVTRQVWLLNVVRPALVLGSSQDRAVVDAAACERSGVDIVRRRSGGGLVLLEPAAQLWADVFIPRDDSLWVEDISVAFEWLGRCWRAALWSLGIETQMAVGRLEVGKWGHLVCFAGRGPGELTSPSGKVVGMSLRRTRTGARFQTLALSAWHPERLVSLLNPEAVDTAEVLVDLHDAATGSDQPPEALGEALTEALAGPGIPPPG